MDWLLKMNVSPKKDSHSNEAQKKTHCFQLTGESGTVRLEMRNRFNIYNETRNRPNFCYIRHEKDHTHHFIRKYEQERLVYRTVYTTWIRITKLRMWKDYTFLRVSLCSHISWKYFEIMCFFHWCNANVTKIVMN